MKESSSAAKGRSVVFTPRNMALIAVALVTIGAGYAVLNQGTESASLAAVLLVIGYVVLLPLALVL